MTWQDLGALGDLVGGVAVVASLAYVAYQIRQNSRLIAQNSRHLEASMYFTTGDAFNRWWALLAQDATLAHVWLQGISGETLERTDRMRFHALLASLFTTYENNFHQVQLRSVHRDTLAISRDTLVALLASPAVAAWWRRQAPRMLTPEFRGAIERIVSGRDAIEGGDA